MRKFRLIVNGKIVLFLTTRNYANIIGISSLYTAVAVMLAKMNREKVNGMLEDYSDGYIQIDFETGRF